MEAIKQTTQNLLKTINDKIKQVKARLAAQQEEDDPNPTEINRLTKLIKNLKLDRNRYEQELMTANKIQTKQGEENLTSLQKDADEQRKEYEAKVKERNETEAGLNRTKTLNELDEQERTLKRRIEEAKQVIDDENATSEQKQAAAASIEADTGQLERLQQQMQQREETLLLRERVKRIFKKYGWTLQAVVLATGLVLGAVALAAMNGFKAGTKAVGKGLKTIGQKLGSLLPGLIGSIVSFIFRAAGQVLSFLGEHAWLLILAVVAFFMERLLKKRRKQ